MGNFWLKLKIWTKATALVLVLLYVLFFLYNNSSKPQKIWFFFGAEPETSLILLMLLTFLAGIVATLLTRTVLATFRQIKEYRNRSRAERTESELQQMKLKEKLRSDMRRESHPPTAE